MGLEATITILGSDAKIDGTYPIKTLIDATSYFKKGYQFTAQYKHGTWDGRVRLFHKFTRTFPSGLVPDVVQAFKEEGVRVHVRDHRTQPPAHPRDGVPKLEGVTFEYPYEFQVECMEEMLEKHRGIIHAATNSGKTEIACLVTASLRVPTLFVVPGKELLYQTHERFAKRLNVGTRGVGIIGDGQWKPGQWVTVATVPTLYSKINTDKARQLFNRTELVFFDECHRIGSTSWYEVARACNAFYRFGLSGTPLKRTDGADLRLVAVTGSVIYKITNKNLIERGISNSVEIEMMKIEMPNNIHPNTPWQDVYKMGIVENTYRDRKLCNRAAEYIEQGRQAVFLVSEIDHGHRLDERLWTFQPKSFLPHQFISGQESTDVRRKAIEDYKKGELKALIATSIMDEGVDIPNIDVLVLAGGKKSSIKTLQRIGRGLRRGGASDKLIVIDTADFTHSYLLEHSLQRLNDYKAEGCFTIKAA